MQVSQNESAPDSKVPESEESKTPLKAQIVELIGKINKTRGQICEALMPSNAHIHGTVTQWSHSARTLDEFIALVKANGSYPPGIPLEFTPGPLFCGPIHEASTFVIVENNCGEQTRPTGLFTEENWNSFDYSILFLETLIETVIVRVVLSSPDLLIKGSPALYRKMRDFLIHELKSEGLGLSHSAPFPSRVYVVDFNSLRKIIYEAIKKMLCKLNIHDTFLACEFPVEFFDLIFAEIPQAMFIADAESRPPPVKAIYCLKAFLCILVQSVKVERATAKHKDWICAPKRFKVRKYCHKPVQWLKEYIKELECLLAKLLGQLEIAKKAVHAHFFNATPTMPNMIGNDRQAPQDGSNTWVLIRSKCEKIYPTHPVAFNSQQLMNLNNVAGTKKGFDYVIVPIDELISNVARMVAGTSPSLEADSATKIAELIAYLKERLTERGMIFASREGCRLIYKVKFCEIRRFLTLHAVGYLREQEIKDTYLYYGVVPRQFFEIAIFELEPAHYIADFSDSISDPKPYLSVKDFPEVIKLALGLQKLRLC